jgi:hypothetical protein
MKKLLAVVMLLSMAACNASTAQKLSQASDVFSKALLTFQQGEQLAVQAGKISAQEDTVIQGALIQVGTAGQALNKAIRANESAPNVEAELNNVIDAVNSLIQSGVGGIKDVNTKQELNLALTGAEAAIAVIASVVGSKSPAASAAGATTKTSWRAPDWCRNCDASLTSAIGTQGDNQ